MYDINMMTGAENKKFEAALFWEDDNLATLEQLVKFRSTVRK